MKLLSISQAAHQLAVSEVSVRRWIRNGTLKHVRLARCLRVLQDDVNRVIKIPHRGGAMKLTLKNATNPLQLYKQLFDEHVIVPILAAPQSIRNEHARNERALIAQRAR